MYADPVLDGAFILICLPSRLPTQFVQACKDRWKNIRNRYAKYKKLLSLPSGSAVKRVKEYYLAQHLHFLDKYLKSRPSKSNLEPQCRKRQNSEKQMQPLDTDLAFLQSMLSDMKAMNLVQKRRFKMGVMQLAAQILDGNEAASTLEPAYSTRISQNNIATVSSIQQPFHNVAPPSTIEQNQNVAPPSTIEQNQNVAPPSTTLQKDRQTLLERTCQRCALYFCTKKRAKQHVNFCQKQNNTPEMHSVHPSCILTRRSNGRSREILCVVRENDDAEYLMKPMLIFNKALCQQLICKMLKIGTN
ncbi:unnamed protein product [Colias eurytheme]|nr:unnamed protein product [Colias eurytheme]